VDGRVAEIDLVRFRDGYRAAFHQACSELRRGRKRSHWMWFIFPQVAGLGTSPAAVRYAIRNRTEAEAFLADPELGVGYRQLVDIVWTQVVAHRVPVGQLFGAPDDRKLVSSLTLFAGVAADLDDEQRGTRFIEQANEILDHAEAEHVPRCVATQRFVRPDSGRP